MRSYNNRKNTPSRVCVGIRLALTDANGKREMVSVVFVFADGGPITIKLRCRRCLAISYR